MKTFDEILLETTYTSCYFLRSAECTNNEHPEIGINEEGLIEDDRGYTIFGKLDVWHIYFGVEEMIKVCFEI